MTFSLGQWTSFQTLLNKSKLSLLIQTSNQIICFAPLFSWVRSQNRKISQQFSSQYSRYLAMEQLFSPWRRWIEKVIILYVIRTQDVLFMAAACRPSTTVGIIDNKMFFRPFRMICESQMAATGLNLSLVPLSNRKLLKQSQYTAA